MVREPPHGGVRSGAGLHGDDLVVPRAPRCGFGRRPVVRGHERYQESRLRVAPRGVIAGVSLLRREDGRDQIVIRRRCDEASHLPLRRIPRGRRAAILIHHRAEPGSVVAAGHRGAFRKSGDGVPSRVPDIQRGPCRSIGRRCFENDEPTALVEPRVMQVKTQRDARRRLRVVHGHRGRRRIQQCDRLRLAWREERHEVVRVL